MGEPFREDDRLQDLELPRAFTFLVHPPLGSCRYRVAYGGRGSAKSWSFARVLLAAGMDRPLRILCAREFQSSIRDSVHRLLTDQIVALGLEHFYEMERTRLRGANGTEFFFYGVRQNPHSIKSLEGVDLCWVEEAEAISKESWEILVPTIRSQGSEIWASFNPRLPDDHIYREFVSGDPPTNSVVRQVSWRDNPYISQTLRQEREDMLRRDPEAEAHVWGGEPWERSDSQVLGGKWRIAEFEPDDSWGDPLYGADWGFSTDPTTVLRFWIYDNRLWIEYEERGTGWSIAETNRRFRRIPGLTEHTVRADCSRPETINELRLLGLNVIGAKKWSGSVEDGIEHLRAYEEIIIHLRCPGIAQDARLWRYKTDPRTDDVLPKLVDGNEHGWDGVRYGLEPMIRKRRAWGLAT